MNTATLVDNKVLTAIRATIDAYGASTFAELLYEIRTQCEVGDLTSAHQTLKDGLDHLVSLNILVSENYGFGIAYGYPSDF